MGGESVREEGLWVCSGVGGGRFWEGISSSPTVIQRESIEEYTACGINTSKLQAQAANAQAGGSLSYWFQHG